jgi:heme oxygenase
MKKLAPQPILDLLDDFNHAREALVQGLKKLGFSDEQAYAKLMRHQTETQQMYRSFKEELDCHEVTYDWQGRKKLTVTQKDLDTEA